MKNGTKHFPENQLINWTNGTGSAVSSGDPVQVGDRWGIAQADIADGATGILHTRGRFKFTKLSGTAMAQGAFLWWDATNSRVTTTDQDGPPIGYVAVAAASADTSVEVNIGEPHNAFAVAHVVTTAEGVANEATLDTGFGVDPTGPVIVTIYSTADPKVPRLPASVDFNGDGTLTVAHASLNTNEQIHVIAYR